MRCLPTPGSSRSIHRDATLTGESVPAEKDSGALPADAPVNDRRNMVIAGTMVTSGRGTAAVTTTAMQTELGRIAREVAAVKAEPTPLETRTSLRSSIAQAPPHRWLQLAVLWELAVVFALVRIPAVRGSFGIQLPSAADLGTIAGSSMVALFSMELVKKALYRKARPESAAGP